MNISYCAICGKPLLQHGIRLEKLYYNIGAGFHKINDDGVYIDGTLGWDYICKDCFTEKNKEKIVDILFGKIFYGSEESRHTLAEAEWVKGE